MSIRVLEEIRRLRPDVEVHAYDPVITPSELARVLSGVSLCDSLNEAVRGAAVVIIANNHPAFGELPPAALQELMQANGFVYDYWNHFSNLSGAELGTTYLAVGNIRGERE
jgi:UDP-N-acetyl-D-mannosaminuronic acid dehydrogenase